MNYIPQLKKEDVMIRLVINTFTGNSQEYHQTEQLLYLIKVKNIKVFETIDVNQEQILERDKKLRHNPRDYYYRQGKMFRINSKLTLPQIIIDETLVINYNQFLTLNESGYLDKLLNRTVCEHIRFFKNDIVYVRAKISESVCIYCYSNKKIKKQISVICNLRDYFDDENNDLLAYLEKNEIRFEVFDYENQFEIKNEKIKSLLKSDKSKTIIMGESEPISFEEFYENKINPKCDSCGKKIPFSMYRCGICLSASSDTAVGSSEKKTHKKNPYNFIEKLQLTKKDYEEVTKKEVQKVLNYSFGSNEFEI